MRKAIFNVTREKFYNWQEISANNWGAKGYWGELFPWYAAAALKQWELQVAKETEEQEGRRLEFLGCPWKCTHHFTSI